MNRVVTACLVACLGFAFAACSKAREAEEKVAAAAAEAKKLADVKLPSNLAEAKKLAQAAAEMAPSRDEATARRKAPDACTIVPKEVLGETFGDTFGDGSVPPNSYPTVSVCSYVGEKGTSVSIRTEVMTAADHFERTIAYLKGGTNVAGVGEKAYSQVNKTYGVTVRSFLAAKGDLLVGLTIGGMNLDEAKLPEIEKALATKMLAAR